MIPYYSIPLEDVKDAEKFKGGTFAENRVKYTVVCKDFRNNHGISDIGIERWTPV